MDISNFDINTHKARGFQSYCKTCKSVCYQEWKAKNTERKKLIDKKSRVKNAEIIKVRKREYYRENKEKEKERLRKYIGVEKTEEQIKKRNARYNKYYNNNIQYKLNKLMRNAIKRKIKGEKCGLRWEKIIHWKIEDLMKHLSSQFTAEMSWENHGAYWHIDHIIPLSSFNFKSYKDLNFKRCWSLVNLQPLEAHENIKKSNKILPQHYDTREKLMMIAS